MEYEDTQKGKYLIFSIGKEDYGIEIKNVIEIIGIQPITEVPELEEYIRGIINLRGKIIPVMDIRVRFKKEPREYNDRTCIVIIEIGDICVGLIVDTVSEVVNIKEDQIADPPKVNGKSNRYISGIGKQGEKIKMIINCTKLLNFDEGEELSKLSQIE